MTLKTIAGVVLAVLLVTGTAAALPGAAPAQADDHANETDADAADAAASDGNETDANDEAEAADEGDDGDSADAADRRGPPSDMPAPVPDFVGDVHDLIGQKLAGDLTGSLGERVSALTPGDADEQADEGAGGPGETPAAAPV